jgi:hypothetical protein
LVNILCEFGPATSYTGRTECAATLLPTVLYVKRVTTNSTAAKAPVRLSRIELDVFDRILATGVAAKDLVLAIALAEEEDGLAAVGSLPLVMAHDTNTTLVWQRRIVSTKVDIDVTSPGTTLIGGLSPWFLVVVIACSLLACTACCYVCIGARRRRAKRQPSPFLAAEHRGKARLYYNADPSLNVLVRASPQTWDLPLGVIVPGERVTVLEPPRSGWLKILAKAAWGEVMANYVWAQECAVDPDTGDERTTMRPVTEASSFYPMANSSGGEGVQQTDNYVLHEQPPVGWSAPVESSMFASVTASNHAMGVASVTSSEDSNADVGYIQTEDPEQLQPQSHLPHHDHGGGYGSLPPSSTPRYTAAEGHTTGGQWANARYGSPIASPNFDNLETEHDPPHADAAFTGSASDAPSSEAAPHFYPSPGSFLSSTSLHPVDGGSSSGGGSRSGSDSHAAAVPAVHATDSDDAVLLAIHTAAAGTNGTATALTRWAVESPAPQLHTSDSNSMSGGGGGWAAPRLFDQGEEAVRSSVKSEHRPASSVRTDGKHNSATSTPTQQQADTGVYTYAGPADVDDVDGGSDADDADDADSADGADGVDGADADGADDGADDDADDADDAMNPLYVDHYGTGEG